MLSRFGMLSRRQGFTHRDPSSPCTARFTRSSYPFTTHSAHPYLHISLIGEYHLYNTVHYIKNHYVAMYKLLLHPYTHLSLNTVVCSRLLACVVVHTLACNYHRRSLAAFFHSFTSLTLCVYFPRIALSGLSLVVCLFLIGLRQRDIAVLVSRNL
ncbi:hypothetical protein BJV77DRAFT_280226 [Russula vinacea]|nr:hypothetical protein BJV77DRAFT_280226 [Russula vinacea]